MPHLSIARASAIVALALPLIAFPALAQLPEVRIDDTTVTEGDAGSADARLRVTLSAAATGVVTVAYATENANIRPATGGASCSGNADFVTESGTVQFSPGQTSRPLGVAVCGDTAVEDNERFRVRLSNAVGATIEDPTGRVTITNDDPITVSVRDTTIDEGDLGTPEGKYTLTLSRPATGLVEVDLVVQGGSATFGSGCTGGADFRSVFGGTVDFSPGQTSQQPSFSICSDLNAEADETFSVTLRRPSGAVLGDAVGQVTIKNDDIAGQVVPRDEDIVVRLEPARADLSLDMVSLLTQVAPNLAFGVRVRNTGAVTASNVLVRSTLPRDVAFVGLEENTMGTCSQNSTTSDGSLQVNCTVPSLPAGGNRGVRILGRVVGTIPDNSQFIFAANVDPANAIPEGNDTDNTAFLVATVRAPSDLQVTGIATSHSTRGRGPVFAGANCLSGNAIRLDLTVKNNGPNPSRATRVGTVWPRGIVSSQSSTCFDSCNVPPLNPGQSVAIIMGGLVEANLAGGTRITSTADPASTVFDSVLDNNKVTFTCE